MAFLILPLCANAAPPRLCGWQNFYIDEDLFVQDFTNRRASELHEVSQSYQKNHILNQ